MNVALFGAGAWGQNLAANLYELGALFAIAEPNAAMRDRMKQRYPTVPIFEDYRALLDAPVPAVAIATPVPTHHAMVKEALLAGKDVFVEKPMTLSSAEATELTAIAELHGRVLMVGHLLLYQPAIRWIKDAIGMGAIGELVSLHQERLNLGRARAVENVLWSFGVHDLAVLLDLVGAAPEVVTATGQRVLNPAVEDDVHVHLGWRNGVQAHLHTSWLWPEKQRKLTVVGTEGMIVYDELEQAVYLHHKGIGPDLAIRDDGWEVAFTGAGEPLKLELGHFLERMRDRRAPLSDGRSGVAVVRVLEEAERSLEEERHGLLRA